jgi:peptide/nickel transport system substrate-binding protein
MKTVLITRKPLCLLALLGLSTLLLSAMLSPALAHPQSGSTSAPQYGGTLYYRDTGFPTCVDPLPAPTTVEGVIDFATFDNLVLLDGKGTPRPDLATGWKFSHGGKWITFTLRHGVKFSNGDPFDANTVKFNIQRALGPVGAAAGMSALLGPLHAVHVDNKYQVTLILNEPFRPLLPNLANDSLGIVDPKALKQEGKTKFCQYPIGSGPFKIQNYGPGGNPVTLVRNPLHNWETPWAHNHGEAYLSKIVIKPIVSDSTAVSELLSGGVDISQVAGSQLGRVEHNRNITLHKVQSQFEFQLGFNTSHPPFNKAEVRRAIAEAIDRNALIKVALNGLGKPAYSPIPSNVPYYDPSTKNIAPRYDPAAARKILAANHVTGPYTLISGNSPDRMAADALIQAELADVGVKVTIVAKPTPDWISMAQKGQFDLSLDGFYAPDADVLYLTYHSSQETSGGLNFTFYKNPTLDKLIVEGRTTNNPKRAAKIYAQAQRLILNNVITDPLYSPVTVFGTRSNVKGFHTDVTGLWPLFQDLYLSK